MDTRRVFKPTTPDETKTRTHVRRRYVPDDGRQLAALKAVLGAPKDVEVPDGPPDRDGDLKEDIRPDAETTGLPSGQNTTPPAP